MNRVVLDTNVVASAMLWGGSPRLLLDAARERRITLICSVPMLNELTDILGRAKFARRIEASGLGVDDLVEGYALLTRLVRPAALPRVAPDPDDDVVIATALAGEAGSIVTGDKALLSVKAYASVRLETVAQALSQRIKS